MTTKRDLTGITDRHSEGRSGGKRWRLRMRGVPGHEGIVTELFDDLDAAVRRRNELRRKREGGRENPAERAPVEAGAVTLTAIRTSYLKTLRLEKPTDHYLETVELVLTRAIASGLDNVRSPTWADDALEWLDTLAVDAGHPRAGDPASTATRNAYRAILGGALNHAADERRWLERNPLHAKKKRRTKHRKLERAARHSEKSTHKIIPVPLLATMVSDRARFIHDARRQEAVDAIAAHNGDKQAAAVTLKCSLASVYNRLARPADAEDPRWLIAVLMAYTGMRLGQAVELEWRDVNLPGRTLRFRPEVVGNRSGTDKVVEIEDELHDILAGIVPSGPHVVPTPAERDSKRGTVRHMSRAWLKDAFDAFLARNGAGDHNAHDFRHTFICMLTAMGTPTADVQRRVNHADSDMTSRYADHLLNSYRSDCAGWGGKLRLRNSPPSPRIVPMAGNGTASAG